MGPGEIKATPKEGIQQTLCLFQGRVRENPREMVSTEVRATQAPCPGDRVRTTNRMDLGRWTREMEGARQMLHLPHYTIALSQLLQLLPRPDLPIKPLFYCDQTFYF